jgi:hypothetical protein
MQQQKRKAETGLLHITTCEKNFPKPRFISTLLQPANTYSITQLSNEDMSLWISAKNTGPPKKASVRSICNADYLKTKFPDIRWGAADELRNCFKKTCGGTLWISQNIAFGIGNIKFLDALCKLNTTAGKWSCSRTMSAWLACWRLVTVHCSLFTEGLPIGEWCCKQPTKQNAN